MSDYDSEGPDDGGYDHEKEEQLKKLRKWSKQHDSHWGEWQDEARTGFDMVAGEQWEKEAKDELKEKLRIPVVFNRIDPMVSAVSGAEITNRQEVKYYAREATGPEGQAEANEMMTAAADWARDECDAGDEESDAFWDTLVCGMGWTETRMDYADDQEGMPVIERIDPLEMTIYPCTKKNCTDGRALRRRKKYGCDDYEEKFGEEFEPGGPTESTKGPHSNTPGDAYDDVEGKPQDDGDTVTVDEWQWWELESIYMMPNPMTGAVEPVDEDTYEKLQTEADKRNIPLKYAKVQRKRFYRAYLKGEELIGEVEELPDGEFTYKCVTGKRDRNKGTWYGLVRPMVDPQRWSNKFYSQIIHIINANAKGGVIVEEDAVEDPRDFEENYSRSDSVTWAMNGAVSGGKIMPKPQTPYPMGLDRLMTTATQAVTDVTGVNKEMLGMVERDQAGVLEYQRKQAAYGLLAPFFDALKRYRRLQGRLLLKYIAKYMSDGRLIRVVGKDGGIQYLPLARDPDFAKYDVIVDEAPSGPNQKERTFAMLQPFIPLLKEAGPEIMAEVVKYMPIPTSLSNKLAEHLTNMAQPNPEAEQAKVLQFRQLAADASKSEAAAAKDVATTEQIYTETALMPAQVAAANTEVRVNT